MRFYSLTFILLVALLCVGAQDAPDSNNPNIVQHDTEIDEPPENDDSNQVDLSNEEPAPSTEDAIHEQEAEEQDIPQQPIDVETMHTEEIRTLIIEPPKLKDDFNQVPHSDEIEHQADSIEAPIPVIQQLEADSAEEEEQEEEEEEDDEEPEPDEAENENEEVEEEEESNEENNDNLLKEDSTDKNSVENSAEHSKTENHIHNDDTAFAKNSTTDPNVHSKTQKKDKGASKEDLIKYRNRKTKDLGPNSARGKREEDVHETHKRPEAAHIHEHEEAVRAAEEEQEESSQQQQNEQETQLNANNENSADDLSESEIDNEEHTQDNATESTSTQEKVQTHEEENNAEQVSQEKKLYIPEEPSKSILEEYRDFMNHFMQRIDHLLDYLVVPFWLYVRHTTPLNYIFFSYLLLYVIHVLTRGATGLFERKPKFNYNREMPLNQAELAENLKIIKEEMAEIKQLTESNGFQSQQQKEGSEPKIEEGAVQEQEQNQFASVEKIADSVNSMKNLQSSFEKAVIESETDFMKELANVKQILLKRHTKGSEIGSALEGQAQDSIDLNLSRRSSISSEQESKTTNNKIAASQKKDKNDTPKEKAAFKTAPLAMMSPIATIHEHLEEEGFTSTPLKGTTEGSLQQAANFTDEQQESVQANAAPAPFFERKSPTIKNGIESSPFENGVFEQNSSNNNESQIGFPPQTQNTPFSRPPTFNATRPSQPPPARAMPPHLKQGNEK